MKFIAPVDVMMSEMDGPEFVTKMKEQEEFASVTVFPRTARALPWNLATFGSTIIIFLINTRVLVMITKSAVGHLKEKSST